MPDAVVKIVENGPYQVKGPVRLVDHDNNVYDLEGKRSYLLCRCGQSANKPFCDGAHVRTGFSAGERAETAG
ncbi:CDGSH iron-sulfur domain-containing protein [Amycolatopsis sp. SID8362]|nr:CDGSH iron-sulfur domain-containing protein [Amycolatopsis sp. SID8362]NED40171.1 CDGSH iron-sulfur domain-containing protein [Amycolatopsis sp. SID8362]